ncbi:MAG TPA: F0F1 ATP synthase subunit A [Deltaproteobacteria bacterium]|jgi:F-type H+-transporting ATPase subunit a|nr:F0F1 ATP synthase subunit A [Deltaproteobacteria bacterium]HQI00258.1 F0F1 ATP synthase subunit A [Deltaproteobacteria bacterium]HQJ07941.1 F0F1 ATP synthase subunit A [Deltaproteobacteria bacterium]
MEILKIGEITPDAVILWQAGWIKLNVTILYTWITMAALTILSWLATRRISSGRSFGQWQNFLEAVVETISGQIRDIANEQPGKYIAFIGTLFLFIAFSNFFMELPGYVPPTSSLSTTAGLAICVFFAVPVYGIANEGFLSYLKQYTKPTPLMLPFNIMGEFTRTLALAVRLFGNIMSETKIAAILLAVIPFFFPVIMQALGLLIGMIQAFIFTVLAMIYIASAERVGTEERQANEK